MLPLSALAAAAAPDLDVILYGAHGRVAAPAFHLATSRLEVGDRAQRHGCTPRAAQGGRAFRISRNSR